MQLLFTVVSGSFFSGVAIGFVFLVSRHAADNGLSVKHFRIRLLHQQFSLNGRTGRRMTGSLQDVVQLIGENQMMGVNIIDIQAFQIRLAGQNFQQLFQRNVADIGILSGLGVLAGFFPAQKAM